MKCNSQRKTIFTVTVSHYNYNRHYNYYSTLLMTNS